MVVMWLIQIIKKKKKKNYDRRSLKDFFMVFGNIKFSLKQYVHTKKEMKLVIPFFFCITRLLHRI